MKTLFVFTGPESTGKTTLALQCAKDHGLPLVQEFARLYLENKNPGYTLEDLTTIANQQQEWEDQSLGSSVVCDTDLLTLYVWKKDVFGVSDHPLLEALQKHHRFYLLCRPDIDWVADPLRENPFDRARLFDIYLSLIQELQLPYTIIEGQSFSARHALAYRYMEAILKKQNF